MYCEEEEKCMELWHHYMEWDKRGFNEFFSEEFGITINECISYEQLKFLCETLIPHAKTYYHPKRTEEFKLLPSREQLNLIAMINVKGIGESK
jgi:hypothetical protein